MKTRCVSRRTIIAGGLGATALLAAGCSGSGPTGSPQYLDGAEGSRLPVAPVDVIVYGATPGGIAAAVSAAELGRSVALLEPSGHLGGMMTSGLSIGDVADRRAIGGFADRVFRSIGRVYGVPRTFDYEPHVARNVFADMLRRANVTPLFGQRVLAVRKNGQRVESVSTRWGEIAAATFIDATYEGDLLALAGAATRVGREAREVFGEIHAGVTGPVVGNIQVPSTSLGRGAGSSFASPLEPSRAVGSGDAAVQAYGFRLCLERTSDHDWPAPPGYRRDDFAVVADATRYGWNPLVFLSPLPNGKFDLNSTGIVGSDLVGGSAAWTSSDYDARSKIWQAHMNWISGMLHFLSTDNGVPEKTRENARTLSLARDEFVTSGGWPTELYVREARRLVGRTTVTEREVLTAKIPNDSIALASYKIDSHPCHRVDSGGSLAIEGSLDVPVSKAWGVPLSATVPLAGPENLATATTISTSHVAWCSARMEPTFMAIGEAVGLAAALASQARSSLLDVPYQGIREALATRRAAFTLASR